MAPVQGILSGQGFNIPITEASKICPPKTENLKFCKNRLLQHELRFIYQNISIESSKFTFYLILFST